MTEDESVTIERLITDFNKVKEIEPLPERVLAMRQPLMTLVEALVRSMLNGVPIDLILIAASPDEKAMEAIGGGFYYTALPLPAQLALLTELQTHILQQVMASRPNAVKLQTADGEDLPEEVRAAILDALGVKHRKTND